MKYTEIRARRLSLESRRASFPPQKFWLLQWLIQADETAEQIKQYVRAAIDVDDSLLGNEVTKNVTWHKVLRSGDSMAKKWISAAR